MASVKADYDHLLMRMDGDFRPDHVVKEEIYRLNIEPYFDVRMAFDDNPSIIALWKRLGIPVTVVPGWEEQ